MIVCSRSILLIFTALYLLLSNHAIAKIHKPSTDQLNSINQLVYQYPTKALAQLNNLETDTNLTQKHKIRIGLLRCQAFIELGDIQAAINLGRSYNVKITQWQQPLAKPYFLNCIAAGYIHFGDFQRALPILDSAIQFAREHQQAQALVNSLLLRARIDTAIDSYSNGIDDLRLALELYPNMLKQKGDWSYPPLAYLHIAMADILIKQNEPESAIYNIVQSLKYKDSRGKVVILTSLKLAQLALLANRDNVGTLYEQIKNQLPELSSAYELAIVYQQLAEIELLAGSPTKALQLLTLAVDIFQQQNRQRELLLTQVTLVKTRLALNLIDEAQTLANSILPLIQTAEYQLLQLKLLKILSQHYAKNAQYELAFQYQQALYQANQQAYSFFKETRILQLNAQLSKQRHSGNQTVLNESVTSTTSNLKFDILIGIIILLVVVLLSYLSYQHQQNRHMEEDELTDKQTHVDTIVNFCKEKEQALSLLLLTHEITDEKEIAQIHLQLRKLLRDDDILTDSAEGIVLLLPHTRKTGTLNMIKLIKDSLNRALPSRKFTIGCSSLQQQDDLASLIKKASIQQLRYQAKLRRNNN